LPVSHFLHQNETTAGWQDPKIKFSLKINSPYLSIIDLAGCQIRRSRSSFLRATDDFNTEVKFFKRHLTPNLDKIGSITMSVWKCTILVINSATSEEINYRYTWKPSCFLYVVWHLFCFAHLQILVGVLHFALPDKYTRLVTPILSCAFKGTVTRDLPSGFFSLNGTPGSPDSWAKVVLKIDSNWRSNSIRFF
jgi:hypothetical protein